MRVAWYVLALPAVVIGCGSNNDSATSTATPTETSTAAETTGATPSKARVQLRVAVAKPGQSKVKFASSASVRAGERVSLFAIVTNAGRDGTLVELTIPKGPVKRLRPRVSIGERGSQVTIRSATGASVALKDPRYSCTLPPKTICPAKTARITSGAYRLAFTVRDGSPPVAVSAVVP